MHTFSSDAYGNKTQNFIFLGLLAVLVQWCLGTTPKKKKQKQKPKKPASFSGLNKAYLSCFILVTEIHEYEPHMLNTLLHTCNKGTSLTSKANNVSA